ncbi:MAG: flagellar biosynthetic protein FliO [Thermodesulfobacteriota bacterium]
MPSLAHAVDNATQALPGPDLGAAWWNMTGGLVLVLGILLVAYWLLKRYGPKTGLGMFKRGGLTVEGQLALGPRKSVVVVRFLNKVMVLGVTETQINLLTEVDDPHDPSSRTDFSETLQQAGREDTP